MVHSSLLKLFAASGECNELRRVAVRRVRWRRTARLKEPQEQRLFLSSSALSPKRVEDCGAHSNVSCGPPRSEASARAALRAAEAQHPFIAQFSELRPVAHSPERVRPRRAPLAPLMRRSRRGRRFKEPRYSLSPPSPGQEFCPKPSPMRGPTRRENRFRFSRPKNKCRPGYASLRLRLRSAAFYRRPLGFHLDFAHRKTSEIPLYAGGRRFLRAVLCSRA